MNKIDKLIQLPITYPKATLLLKNALGIFPVLIVGTISYPWSIDIQWIKNANGWVSNHWYFVPLLLAFPVIISLVCDFWEYFGKLNEEELKDSIPEKQMLAVLTGLGSIVGLKCDRFGKFRKAMMASPKRGCDIFEEITQPKTQIEEIVKQIYYSMKIMLNDEEIKIILARINKQKPVEWMTYLPSLEKPPDVLLNRTDTFIYEVIEKGQLVFIEDINKEVNRGGKKKKRFLSIDGDQAIGSIVGIPIRNRHVASDIRYILTIKSDRIGTFNSKYEKRFGKIMKEFTNRILVEDNLLEIKSMVATCPTAA